MNEPHVHDEKYIYLQLENAPQFRLSRVKEIKKYPFQKSMTEKR